MPKPSTSFTTVSICLSYRRPFSSRNLCSHCRLSFCPQGSQSRSPTKSVLALTYPLHFTEYSVAHHLELLSASHEILDFLTLTYKVTSDSFIQRALMSNNLTPLFLNSITTFRSPYAPQPRMQYRQGAERHLPPTFGVSPPIALGHLRGSTLYFLLQYFQRW